MRRQLTTFLETCRLRFASPADEAAFFKVYCLDKIRVTRGAAFVAGVGLYFFYAVDQVIDPVDWQKAFPIRSFLMAPALWLAALLTFVPRLQVYVEYITTITGTIVILLLLWALLYLRHVFDFAEPGLIIIYFFIATLMPMRVVFYVVIYGVAWLAAVAAQVWSGDYRPGMLFINNLYTGTALFLAMIAVVSRELDARRQFLANRDLAAARAQVENLLNAFLPPEEIARIRKRREMYPESAPHIAISYRRADTEAVAGRIRDRLVGYYGAEFVFRDVESIPVGLDFRSHIQSVLQTADILIVLVGPRWLEQEEGRHRIREEVDPVRVELEIALAESLVVLPVLVGGAAMPAADDLPESLREFAFRNATEVGSGRDFNHHMERLVRAIDEIFDSRRHVGSGASGGG